MKGLFAFAAAAGVANAFGARAVSNSTELSSSISSVGSAAQVQPSLSTPVAHVSQPAASSPAGNTTQLTTSTIYTTQIRTIIHCPETVVNCPLKPSVVTETIAISTTVCPVTEVQPPHSTPVAPPPKLTPSPPPAGNWTSTLYTTKTFVITKCGPEVPDCPVGHTTTTTYAVGTTYVDVPGKNTQPGKPVSPPVETPGKPVSPPASTQPGKPISPPVETPGKPVSPPASTQPAKPVGPPALTTPGPAVTIPRPSGAPQVTAGAARNGFEVAAAAAGLAAFFL